MQGSRIEALRTAAKTFLDTFLDGNNEVMIIKYAEDVLKTNTYTFIKDKNTAENQLTTYPNGGTNIDAGLTKAYNYITDSNTSVILMTDGLPSSYIDSGNRVVTKANGKTYSKECETAANEAIKAASRIKDGKGSKIYSIGFGLNDISGKGYDGKKNSTHAKEIMQSIASPTEIYDDGSQKNYYFETANQAELTKAFGDIVNSITSEADGEPIPVETTNGILTIENGFEEGQNVQIYTGTYTKGTTPYATYSWSNFVNGDYATYEDGKIKFNLGKYMEDKGMAANENVTIRFVAPNASTLKARISSANVFSLLNDIYEEEEISEETVAEYEEKFNKAEQEKAATTSTETNTEANKKGTENGISEDNKVEDNTTGNTVTENTNKTVENTEVDSGNTTTTKTEETTTRKPEQNIPETETNNISNDNTITETEAE